MGKKRREAEKKWVWNVKYLHIPQNIAIFASGIVGLLRLYLFDLHIYKNYEKDFIDLFVHIYSVRYCAGAAACG